jgi:hypothetical protein
LPATAIFGDAKTTDAQGLRTCALGFGEGKSKTGDSGDSKCLAEGYSTAEIARALRITEDTVRTHIKRMPVRLNARTRAQAVAIAFREGLWSTASRNGGREGD